MSFTPIIDPRHKHDARIVILGPLTEESDVVEMQRLGQHLEANGYTSVTCEPTMYGGQTWPDYRTHEENVILAMTQARTAVLLPNWDKSPRAILFQRIAVLLGVHLYDAEFIENGYYVFREWVLTQYSVDRILESLLQLPSIEQLLFPVLDRLSKTRAVQAESSSEETWQEAERIVVGERRSDYGTPYANFSKMGLVWTGLLFDKLKEGEVVTAEDSSLMMVGAKLTRETNKKKRDNITDAHGYLMTYEMIDRTRP